MPFTGSTVPPFLRYGVSHSLLSDTRRLTANEKDRGLRFRWRYEKNAFPTHSFFAWCTRYPFPTLSFRAQREIFLVLRRSLLLSLKVSHFPLSHIRRYTDVQERSLHFGRDDNEDGALLSLFSCRHAKECLFEAHWSKPSACPFSKEGEKGILIPSY